MNDINNFVPSLLNPRTINRDNLSLTQNSVVSRCSLSLKRNRGLAKRNINQTVPVKKRLFVSKETENQNIPNNTNCAKSISTLTDFDLSGYEQDKENNVAPTQLSFVNNLDSISTVNLSVNDFPIAKDRNKVSNVNPTARCLTQKQQNFSKKDISDLSTVHLSSDDRRQFKDIISGHGNEVQTISVLKSKEHSLDFTVFEDLPFDSDQLNNIHGNDVQNISVVKSKEHSLDFTVFEDGDIGDQFNNIQIENVVCNNSLKSCSSATELYKCEEAIIHDLNESRVSISFGVKDCDCIDLTTTNTNIKRILITHKDKEFNIDCDIAAGEHSTESEHDENMNLTPGQKRSGVAVNLEIKKKKLAANESVENPKVLILKTDAIEKLSHVIVQPQNCKLVKRHLNNNKFAKNSFFGVKKDGKSDNLKQISITSFFGKQCEQGSDVTEGVTVEDDATEMSKNIGVSDLKCVRPYRLECVGSGGARARVSSAPRAPAAAAPRPRAAPAAPPHAHAHASAPHAHAHDHTHAHTHTHAHAAYSNSARSGSPIKESLLATKTKSNRTFGTARTIPPYKIVAGTHFAVDAFSYGDIPNVKHYFLTHFHSDHYSGLKKNFCKLLYCSKITGDLCVSRLGVNPKCIHVLNLEETMRIEGVEVTAVDANHCPGAVMLFFCLPNGKTILHTGDFRASPAMESYPVFWNSDVHTIYLDTTYCNPRYDFPTQEQSLEQALALLRTKKTALEKQGKKFASVLIVCGTYTIGKEKFFLGMARRVGCSVWACPEKDKVLQAVEGRSFCSAPAHSCQLHAVPMRDLTHEKLKSYLESLNGAFSEVVAFKPSGWENGKNTTQEKDGVTIHGIPYSEHSSFSELVRFVKFLKPRQVIPTVDISGGIKAVQKYFPCPLVQHEDGGIQSKVTDFFSIDSRQQVPAVT